MTKRFLTFIGTIGLLLLTINTVTAQSKAAFYTALASSSVKTIDAQISQVAGYTTAAGAPAFIGALEMRKAGLVTIPAKKLSIFKQGHKKLESVIKADPKEAEYRFLRLMIQENAPKSLGYSKNIAEDSKMVRDQFASLPAVTQQSIKSYSKKSKSLSGLL
ncbi:hypothetical protein [Niabella drilacis]|uniref:DUF4142 domain-containing protein n=1 Tax=Niabella drilacis (strain DSM 25811 / CCM 8410 / CCUG 62505 / LMG 26954 / E90) TaxID=1285928 RepID=A0A1G6NJD3_NIADE|nr:hypothetical protein [Niabella drilacis]SDC67879.1 hypothetical protein SAMN04487894_103294 [Niabella drilacis]